MRPVTSITRMMSRPSSAIDFSAASTNAWASALITPMLIDAGGVLGESAGYGLRARLGVGERRRGVGPGAPVAVAALGAKLRADRDELGEAGDRVDVAERGDPHEPVRGEGVPEQDRGVAVGRGG